MIWSKTDAGRVEMQSRALVKDRAQRNLLLLIDGSKSEEMLLANVVGLKPEDFKSLEGLGLIAPVPPSGRARNASDSSANDSRIDSRIFDSKMPLDSRLSGDSRISNIDSGPPGDGGPLDYAQFTAALTRLISSELGLRGFTMTLAVEKASTIEELREVAERAIAQIRERKGELPADKARRILFGG